ncbi:GGDEF domain-containing protein [Aquabacterium sp.]|uniref:GGDEF domain-containing protein n=1 Tax=Aquabacterium sp. TaxID=1872578 RepID=UPI002BB25F4E|nr:GGDEF domain-containing protein [Aquabacterium sp.]HSW07369.1 GGDEF domain-containing protein [Aquabacterium sp.]
MNDPIQLLYLGTQVPDLTTSAYGPFVVTAVSSLEEVSRTLDAQTCDALVLKFDAPEGSSTLAGWSGLSRAVLDAALVVVAPEPDSGDALRLLRLGAQDVLPLREASADATARVVRLAVERKRVERAARKAYATDLSTGLPNHAQLMEHMTHLLALREREPAAMAVLAVRLDGLAATEARWGTEAANVLRRKAAVRLRSGLRASDVVASLGGDSFAVLLAWIDDQAAADGVAAKLGQSLRRPFSVAGHELTLGVSVGVGQYPAHGKEADALLRKALAQAAGMAGSGPGGLGRRTERHGAPAANDEG